MIATDSQTMTVVSEATRPAEVTAAAMLSLPLTTAAAVSPTVSTSTSLPTISLLPAAMQNIATLTSTMSCVYVAIGVVGIVTNLAVIYVMLKSKTMMQHVPDLFLLNQSVADLWSAIFVIATVFKDARLQLYGSEGEFVCRVWLTGWSLWVGFVASEYNLVTLTIERYFEIVKPLHHRLFFSRRTAKIVIATVWVWSVFWNTVILVPQSGLINGSCYIQSFWVSPLAKQVFGIFNFTFKLIAPMILFTFCYGIMAMSLKNKVAPALTSSSPKHRQSAAGISTITSVTSISAYARARGNIFKMLVIAIVIHITFWSVAQSLYVAYSFGYPLDFTSALYSAPVAMIYVSSCANPIIYVLKYERFRKAVRETVLSKFSRKHRLSVFNIA